jgi:hypothetical protein
MQKFGNGKGNAEKTKDQLYKFCKIFHLHMKQKFIYLDLKEKLFVISQADVILINFKLKHINFE